MLSHIQLIVLCDRMAKAGMSPDEIKTILFHTQIDLIKFRTEEKINKILDLNQDNS